MECRAPNAERKLSRVAMSLVLPRQQIPHRLHAIRIQRIRHRHATLQLRGGLRCSRAEVRMTLRRGETLLLTVGIPVLLLVFFSLTKVVTTPTKSRVDFVAPGVLASA